MDHRALIDRLEAFGHALPGVVACVTAEDARWKPPHGAWSILEIVCHLEEEERRDFRLRLFQTLRDASQPWAPNDPEAWAREGRYHARDLRAMVRAFVAERAESVTQLRLITAGRPVDWTIAYQHPKVGPVYAGELLASWAAHDALHLRQIAKRMFELAGRDAPGFSTRYAGEWGP
ncbi:MAG: hypothetical protein HBSAPP03_13760 [Phycisphaerae bacterium]|nr:MAG: hypothetical protein HBSAPP03_13760 [Phycisphaerae bacterium]